MRKVKSQLDLNDIAYVENLHGLVVGGFPCPQDKVTGKINPQTSRLKVLGMEEEVSVFHIKPVYYEHSSSSDNNLIFRPMYEVCTHYGNHLVVFDYKKLMEVHPRFIAWLRKRMELINGQVLVTSPFSEIPTPYNFVHEMVHVSVTKPTIGLTVTTVYPDPDPETTTCDGAVVRSFAAGSGASWSTMRDHTDGTTVADSHTNGYDTYIIHDTGSNNFRFLGRNFFLFDTSSIPDTDVISAATLSLFHHNTAVDNSPAQTYHIGSSTPASNTSLALADYDQIGRTSFGSVAGSALTQNAYNAFTLNSSGLSNISKTGVSKFSMQLESDINNSAPTWVSGNASGFYIVMSETSGTTSDPKLAVTHAAGGTTVNASVQSATFSLPTRTIAGKALVSATVQVATFSTPSRTVTGKALVSVNAQSATFSIPAYIVSAGGVILNPSVQTLTFSLPTRDIIYGSNISLNQQTLTFSVQIPTVTADWTVSVNPITLTFTLPTLEFVGALWGRTARTTTGSGWSRSSINNDA